jgi:hypothetical protein
MMTLAIGAENEARMQVTGAMYWAHFCALINIDGPC